MDEYTSECVYTHTFKTSLFNVPQHLEVVSFLFYRWVVLTLRAKGKGECGVSRFYRTEVRDMWYFEHGKV
ncbi:MAG: hypothetical protein ACJATN_000287 [Neolewinella sp.]|jgi:hypothetical protein